MSRTPIKSPSTSHAPDSLLSIRSDSKLALRSRRTTSDDADAALQVAFTPEEREYELRNNTMENLIRRLDQLLQPVLRTIGAQPLDDSLLPRDIRSSLAHKSTAAHHAKLLPNRVEETLKQIHDLEDNVSCD